MLKFKPVRLACALIASLGAIARIDAATLTDFTIYAANNVQIGVGTVVGTNMQNALVGAGNGTIAVGDASLNGTAGIYGDLRAGDDVTLGNGAFVTGTITNPDGYTLGSGVTVGSHVVGTPDLPTLPGATSFSIGVTNASAANNQTLNLAAGSYNNITLGGAVTLNLTAGDYFLNSLVAGNGLTINVALGGGDINLYIKQSFSAGGVQAMNLTGGTWANVYAEAQGFGLTGGDLANVFRIGGGSGTNWKGTVLTTNGSIHLGSGSSSGTVEGYLWSAQNVWLEHGLDVMPPAVVPVPAAVWMFGSALAGLGMLKRRQAAA